MKGIIKFASRPLEVVDISEFKRREQKTYLFDTQKRMQSSIFSRNKSFIQTFHQFYEFEEDEKSDRFGSLLVYCSKDASIKPPYVAVSSYLNGDIDDFISQQGSNQLNDFLKTAAKVFDNQMNNHTNITQMIAYQCDISEASTQENSSQSNQQVKIQIYLEHHKLNLASLLTSNPFSFSEADGWEWLYEMTSVMTFLEAQNRWIGEIQLESIQIPSLGSGSLRVSPFKMTPKDSMVRQYVYVAPMNQQKSYPSFLLTDISKYFKSDVLLTGLSLMRLILNNNNQAQELALNAIQRLQVSEQEINLVLSMCKDICSDSLFSLIASMVCVEEHKRPKGSDIFKFLLNHISDIRDGRANDLFHHFIQPGMNSTYDFKRSPSSNLAKLDFSSMIKKCPSLILFDDDQYSVSCSNRENIRLQRILDGLKKGQEKNQNLINADSFILDNISKISYRCFQAEGTQLSLSPHDNFASQNEISVPLLPRQKVFQICEEGSRDESNQVSDNRITSQLILPFSPGNQTSKSEKEVQNVRKILPHSPVMNTPSFLAPSKNQVPYTFNVSDQDNFQLDTQTFEQEKIWAPQMKDEFSNLLGSFSQRNHQVDPNPMKGFDKIGLLPSENNKLLSLLNERHLEKMKEIQQASIELTTIKREIVEQSALRSALQDENRKLLGINYELISSQLQNMPNKIDFQNSVENYKVQMKDNQFISSTKLRSRSCDPFRSRSDQLKITKPPFQFSKKPTNPIDSSFHNHSTLGKLPQQQSIQVSTLFSPQSNENKPITYQKYRPSPIKSECSELGNSACSESYAWPTVQLNPSTASSTTKHSILIKSKVKGFYEFPQTPYKPLSLPTPTDLSEKPRFESTNIQIGRTSSKNSISSLFNKKQNGDPIKIESQFVDFDPSACQSMDKQNEQQKFPPSLTSVLLGWKNRNSPLKNQRQRTDSIISKDFDLNPHTSQLHSGTQLDSFGNSASMQEQKALHDTLVVSSKSGLLIHKYNLQTQFPLRVTCLQQSSFISQLKSINNHS